MSAASLSSLSSPPSPPPGSPFGTSPSILHQQLSIKDSLPSLATLFRLLRSDPSQGIDSDLSPRQSHFGSNIPPRVFRPSLILLLCRHLSDRTILLLLCLTLCLLAVDLSFDQLLTQILNRRVAIIIWLVVVLILETLSSWLLDYLLADVHPFRPPRFSKVIRNGHSLIVASSSLVVGDVMLIQKGDTLHVDGVLVNPSPTFVLSSPPGQPVHSISSMTSLPSQPGIGSAVYSGSYVEKGSSTMLVLAVGRHCQVQRRLTPYRPPSNMTLRMESIANKIAQIWMMVLLILFCVVSYHFCHDSLRRPFQADCLMILLDHLTTLLCLQLILTPVHLWSLPSLCLGMHLSRLARLHNRPQSVSECELLGAMNVLVVRPPGILSLNRLRVSGFWLDGCAFVNDQPHCLFSLQWLARLISVNSTAECLQNGTVETGILRMILETYSLDFQQLRSECQVLRQSQQDRRWRYSLFSFQGHHYLVLSGHYPTLLEYCSMAHCKADQDPISKHRPTLDSLFEHYQSSYMKTEALVYRSLDSLEYQSLSNHDQPDNIFSFTQNMTFLCLFSLKDQLRPQLRQPFLTATQLGIRSLIVSKQSLDECTNMALSSGLYKAPLQCDDPSFLSGSALCAQIGPIYKQQGIAHPERLRGLLQQLRVVYNARPGQQEILMMGLKQLQSVVGVLTNRPGIPGRLAHCTLCVFPQSCPTTRMKSSVLLQDDGLVALLPTILFSRFMVLTLLPAYLCFFFSSCLTILVPVLLMATLGYGLLLSSSQVLWLYLIIIVFSPMALCACPPGPALKTTMPVGKYHQVLSAPHYQNIFLSSLYQVILLCLLLLYGPQLLDIPCSLSLLNSTSYSTHQFTHITLYFHTLVLMLVCNLLRFPLSSQPTLLSSFSQNLVALFFGCFIICIQSVFLSYGDLFFRVSPLSLSHHLICCLAALGQVLFCGLVERITSLDQFKKVKVFDNHNTDLWEYHHKADQATRINSVFRYSLIACLRRPTRQRLGLVSAMSPP